VSTAGRPVVIERVDAVSLDELKPLWTALLERHEEVWSRLPQRAPDDSWARRRRQYEGWLADEGSFVLVARRGGAAVGYIVVDVGEGDETYLTGERIGTIETLVVTAEERDDGVGGRLFEAAMEELGRVGIDDLLVGHMDGNQAARRFYERRGFKPFVHVLYARRPGAQPKDQEGA
jgi:ribosomal protein S18 acetylase RimI-like enzyme